MKKFLALLLSLVMVLALVTRKIKLVNLFNLTAE